MFSVVIPAYNCEGTIERVLDSVVLQTRVDLIDEVIIINDGSTDHTGQIIKEYIEQHDSIAFKYDVQENRGVSATRNKAIRMAKGEWIALLDADDLWLPVKLERQATIINETSGICFLGSWYPLRILIKERKGLVKLSPHQLCIRNMPNTPSVVFKKDVGMELGLFDERNCYCEDIQFFQKFFLKDSYYVLAEKLIEISIGKRFFAAAGLSAKLKEMHKARNNNVRELRQMHLIGALFMWMILFMNHFKYLRRKISQNWNKITLHIYEQRLKHIK